MGYTGCALRHTGGSCFGVEAIMSFWNSYRAHLLGAMGILPLVACDAQLEADAADLPSDQSPPPLTLTFPGPADTGVYHTATITGIAANTTVYLIGGPAAGNGPCPPQLAGTCVDIANPTVLGSAQANAQGRATIQFAIPYRIPDGTDLYFQAAAASGKSPVLSEVASHPPRTCGELPWMDANNYYVEPETVACAPRPAGGNCPTVANITWRQEEYLFERATGVQGMWVGADFDTTCFEDTVETQCCYAGVVNPGPVIGRPFGVRGNNRLADAGCDPSWCGEVEVEVDAAALASFGPEVQARVIAAWTQHARGEHASVAAFSRFILQLLQLGAPAELVMDATVAMADEIRHARLAFGAASALAGETISAGALDTAGALDENSLVAIVLAAVREGCVGETIAAAQATFAAQACEVASLRELLEAIAVDEQRHAALAWRFVRWAVATHPELAPVVADALAEGPALSGAGVDPHADVLRAWGQLPDADMDAVARQVYASVVVPCGEALLGAKAAEAVA